MNWHLRYRLSDRDLESLFCERGLDVDHATINRGVLAYAPEIEKRLRRLRQLHCGSIRVDETELKVRGQRRYLHRAVDKHGAPVDFLLTAHRDLEAAKRFFRTSLKDMPLLSPGRIGTDGAGVYPAAIQTGVAEGFLPSAVTHRVSRHLQQVIESDHFLVKQMMPKVGGFRNFATARRTIASFEAMLWLRKGLGFSGEWTVRRQTELLALCFGLQKLTKHENRAFAGLYASCVGGCDMPRPVAAPAN